MRKLLPEPVGQIVDKLLKGSDDRARSSRGALAAFTIRVALGGARLPVADRIGALDGRLRIRSLQLCLDLGDGARHVVHLGFAVSVVRCLPEYASLGQIERIRGFLAMGNAITLRDRCLVMIVGIAVLFLAPHPIESEYVLPLAIALICLPAYAVTDFQDGVGRVARLDGSGADPALRASGLCCLLAFVLIAAGSASSHDAATAIIGAAAATWIVAGLQYFLQRRRLAPVIGSGIARVAGAAWLLLSLSLLHARSSVAAAAQSRSRSFSISSSRPISSASISRQHARSRSSPSSISP